MNILRELAMAGARSRLVDLEKQKQQLLKMFPELDDHTEESSEPVPTEPPVGASGRKLNKDGLPFKVWKWWKVSKKGDISAQDVVEGLNLEVEKARAALQGLVDQKLAKRAGRGVFRLV